MEDKYAGRIVEEARKAADRAATSPDDPRTVCIVSEVFQQSSSRWRKQPGARDAFDAALRKLESEGTVEVRDGRYKSKVIILLAPPAVAAP